MKKKVPVILRDIKRLGFDHVVFDQCPREANKVAQVLASNVEG